MIKLDHLLHDITNKLCIIQGQCDKAKNNQEYSLEKISSSVWKCVDLIKLFRKQEQDNRPMTYKESSELVSSWLKSSEIMYEITIDLYKSDFDMDLMVYINDAVMNNIFSNALENAINAKATTFLLKMERFEYYTDYSLVDNGRGMTDEEIRNIGFGYTKGGNGYGISYMRRMATSVDGIALWSSKGKGKGTQFIMRCKNYTE